MIEIKNLSFIYGYGKKKKRNLEILKDVSLSIENNAFFCILGPSGCGKSTLLKIVAGFEKCTSGEILDDGRVINDVSYQRAMVFQEDAVFPWLDVYSNVEYGLSVRKVDPQIRKEKVEYYLNIVGLKGCEKVYPKELSGGMKKRVDLARVLANDPKILLMDEPFGALDALTKEKLQEQLVEIWEGSKKTILFVTHDIEEALFLGDKIAIIQSMKQGGEVKVYDVGFQRPRKLQLKEDPEFQKMRRFFIEELKKYEKNGL
jgi:ABC-type nitrate/sulfonate/bicarbonate transport system ATPase subunit